MYSTIAATHRSSRSRRPAACAAAALRAALDVPLSRARSCCRARRDTSVVHVPPASAGGLPPSPTASPTAVPAATACAAACAARARRVSRNRDLTWALGLPARHFRNRPGPLDYSGTRLVLRVYGLSLMNHKTFSCELGMLNVECTSRPSNLTCVQSMTGLLSPEIIDSIVSTRHPPVAYGLSDSKAAHRSSSARRLPYQLSRSPQLRYSEHIRGEPKSDVMIETRGNSSHAAMGLGAQPALAHLPLVPLPHLWEPVLDSLGHDVSKARKLSFRSEGLGGCATAASTGLLALAPLKWSAKEEDAPMRRAHAALLCGALLGA